MKSTLDVVCSFYANQNSTMPYRANLLAELTSEKPERLAKVQAVRDAAAGGATVETIKALKALVPAFQPSILQQERRGAKYPYQHTGLLAFDIDGKDNAAYTPESIRDGLATIEEVAYCALSVSGGGVWGLVRIAFPERHAEHFEALKIVFSRMGICIDNACKDVTRLRFYSFDDRAHFSHDAPVFAALPPPRPPAPRPPRPRRTSTAGAGRGLLDWAAAELTGAGEGSRNATLCRVAYTLGGHIAGGTLDYHEAERLLLDCAAVWGNIRKDERVIKHSLNEGMGAPIAPTAYSYATANTQHEAATATTATTPQEAATATTSTPQEQQQEATPATATSTPPASSATATATPQEATPPATDWHAWFEANSAALATIRRPLIRAGRDWERIADATHTVRIAVERATAGEGRPRQAAHDWLIGFQQDMDAGLLHDCPF